MKSRLPRWATAIAVSVLPIAALLFVFNHDTPLCPLYLEQTRPDGKISVTLYHAPTFFFSFPGQGSDGPGFLVVTDRMRKRRIYSQKIDILNTIDTIVWKHDRILVGKWITVTLPPTCFDSSSGRM